MSEREGPQRERGATRAARTAPAPAGSSEERAPSEREGPPALPLVTRRDLDTPAGPIALLDADGGLGTPAVLVPGYTGSKEDFALILAPLAATGRRVVAMDQRGQFESPGPEDPAAYTIDALAADVRAVAADLTAPGGGPVHLLGHSFAGLVTRGAVLADPAAVASLTLLDSGPAAISGARRSTMEALRPLLAEGGMAAVYDQLERLAAGDAGVPPRPPELVAFLRLRFLASSPVGLEAMGDALCGEPDRVEELRATAVPVLVAYGEGDDSWSPAVQADMAERLGARHAVISAAAHSPAMENPVETVRILTDFWARCDLPIEYGAVE
jgi:pimeloyl-ACP methyl ester carboxylesterase